MRLLVTGSRTLTRTDIRLLRLGLATVCDMAGTRPALVLHGGAHGCDRFAGEWATAENIPVQVYLPDYHTHGSKAAPLLRNLAMVENCDWVLAVYAPGRNRKGGTWHTVRAAINAGRHVVEVLSDGRLEYTPPPLTLF